MDNTWNFSPASTSTDISGRLCTLAEATGTRNKIYNGSFASTLDFKPITPGSMASIWPILMHEKGRTTDFSYGGILMWVDLFNYEYDIYADTLFIKGVMENDLSRPAFSLPVGRLPFNESINLIKEYCTNHNLQTEFSAVPEYALPEMKKAGARIIEELKDWGDYLYNAESLAFLKGKKMSKKRNHVNQFTTHYPDYHVEPLNAGNADLALRIIDRIDSYGDSSAMASTERNLSRKMVEMIRFGNENLESMILFANATPCAFTIGDFKGDTLFVHIEKALREFNSSYEMINMLFSRHMIEKHPCIRFINREDDAGDIGLKIAKESYHPLEILRKYNVIF